ncbi:MAG: hypothetical protein D3919_10900 [Candidatus Electrothrix sp. AW5]|nr:hypothetical protein [Candidatus Electrothrix gigas]
MKKWYSSPEIIATIATLVGMLAAVALIMAIFFQVYITSQQVTSENKMSFVISSPIHETKSAEEISENIKALQEKLAGAEATIEATAYGVKFKKIEERIEEVSQQTLALRQAINPLKPEEILTIARLTDQVSLLKNDFEQIEKSLFREMDAFYKSILRELETRNNSTNLILIVLIPLVINFLYTLWKDIRTKKETSDNGDQ